MEKRFKKEINKKSLNLKMDNEGRVAEWSKAAPC